MQSFRTTSQAEAVFWPLRVLSIHHKAEFPLSLTFSPLSYFWLCADSHCLQLCVCLFVFIPPWKSRLPWVLGSDSIFSFRECENKTQEKNKRSGREIRWTKEQLHVRKANPHGLKTDTTAEMCVNAAVWEFSPGFMSHPSLTETLSVSHRLTSHQTKLFLFRSVRIIRGRSDMRTRTRIPDEADGGHRP